MKRRVATCLLAVIVAAGCGDSSSSAEPGTSEVLGTTVVIAETTPLSSVPATTSTTSVLAIPIAAAEETVSSTTVTPVETITPEGAFSFPADESGDYFEGEFEYDGYLCQDTWEWEQYECVGYTGGPVPSFLFPDLYCSGSRDRPDCSEYGSGDYFEVEFEYDGYLCRDTWEWEQYECVGYTGGPVPSFLFPDLYCSGSRDRPDCSEYWYLNELNQHDLRTIEGSIFLCQRALLGGWDDYDCSRYTGGDPEWVSFYRPDLRCTEWGAILECDSDEYPSEWEDNWEDECWEDEWEEEWEEECW